MEDVETRQQWRGGLNRPLALPLQEMNAVESSVLLLLLLLLPVSMAIAVVPCLPLRAQEEAREVAGAERNGGEIGGLLLGRLLSMSCEFILWRMQRE